MVKRGSEGPFCGQKVKGPSKSRSRVAEPGHFDAAPAPAPEPYIYFFSKKIYCLEETRSIGKLIQIKIYLFSFNFPSKLYIFLVLGTYEINIKICVGLDL